MKSQITFLLISVCITSFAHAKKCDYKSKDKLYDYINSFAGKLSLSKEEIRFPSSTLKQNVRDFLSMWESCEKYANLQGMGQCYSNALNAAQMLARRLTINGENSMGFEISDKDYHNSVSEEAKSLPVEFRDGLPKNYRDLARQKGWKVLQYRSRTVGNPGNSQSFNRVLFFIEGNPFDKWIQFTVGDPDPTKPERLMDFISIDKRTNPKKLFFTQFYRDSNGKNPHIRDGFDKCFSCHPNGMREIAPAPGSYSKEDAPNLDAFNKKMVGYGQLDWGKAINPAAYGPTRGIDQGCMKCHNGYTGDKAISRGAINALTDATHIEYKMAHELTMPPTSSKSKMRALMYLKNIPLFLDSESLKKFQQELYGFGGESSFHMNLKALVWLSQNKDNTGRPWLSQADYASYSKSLHELNAEGSEEFKSLMNEDRQTSTKQWILEACDNPHEQGDDVDNSGRGTNRERHATPNSGSPRGRSNATHQ